MKPFPALLSLGLALTVVCAQAHALSDSSNFANPRKSAEVSSEISETTPRALGNIGSPASRHVFPVMDEKGLLLTCVAPEMETNKDTDIFKSCSLAPGRTLDDVMHSFVRAAHQQQLELEKAQGPEPPHDDDKEETSNAQK